MAIETSVVARLSKSGEHFEILIDPKVAEEFKEGRLDKPGLAAALEIDAVFKDANKGDKVKEENLKKAFGTEDLGEIAAKILEDGEIQLTTEQRREMVERKMQRIVSSICAEAVDPQTNRPHPPERIKNALAEARFNVDIHKPINTQIQDAIKLLRPIIPIKIEKLRVAIRVPADYAPKAYSHLHKFTIEKEEWQKDGSLVAVIEISAGLQDQLYNELNSFTHGNVETRILK